MDHLKGRKEGRKEEKEHRQKTYNLQLDVGEQLIQETASGRDGGDRGGVKTVRTI